MTATGEPVTPVSAELPSFIRLLLVTDFSPTSAVAAPFAALFAEYYQASIVVAHIIPNAPIETVPQSREAAAAQLHKFISESPIGELDHEIIVGEGPVWDALASIVEQKKIDLIVVGTHGRSGVGKLLMGSVAQRIFSLAPCPVLTVSPRARRSWGPDHQLSKILYATDFSSASLKALPYALSLARQGHAELVLLHAPDLSDATSNDVLMGFHQHLGALIPSGHRNWCQFDTLVSPGDSARVILEAATNSNIDVIVMTGRAYEGSMASFQVPMSVAYRVVAHAPCPVLRVRS